MTHWCPNCDGPAIVQENRACFVCKSCHGTIAPDKVVRLHDWQDGFIWLASAICVCLMMCKAAQ